MIFDLQVNLLAALRCCLPRYISPSYLVLRARAVAAAGSALHVFLFSFLKNSFHFHDIFFIDMCHSDSVELFVTEDYFPPIYLKSSMSFAKPLR